MSRYIDANKLKKSLSIPCASIIEIGETIIAQIDDQPTADVVEVVRCKDCKYFDKDENASESWCECTAHFGKYFAVNENDFCSYGKKAGA